MELDYDLTPGDLVALAVYQADHLPNGKERPRTQQWAWVALLIISGLAAPALAAVSIKQQQASAPDAPLNLVGVGQALFIPVALGVVAVGMMFRKRFVAWLLTRAARTPANHKFLGPHRLRLSSENLTVTSPTSTSAITWEAVDRIVVDSNHLYFFVTAQNAVVLPRRAFADEDHFEDFLENARRYHEWIVEQPAPRGSKTGYRSPGEDPDGRFKAREE